MDHLTDLIVTPELGEAFRQGKEYGLRLAQPEAGRRRFPHEVFQRMDSIADELYFVDEELSRRLYEALQDINDWLGFVVMRPTHVQIGNPIQETPR